MGEGMPWRPADEAILALLPTASSINPVTFWRITALSYSWLRIISCVLAIMSYNRDTSERQERLFEPLDTPAL